MKKTNNRRHGFEYRYKRGGATELDALETFHKGEMARILEREIAHFHDITLENQVKQRVQEIMKELGAIQHQVHQNHNLDEYREEYERVEKLLEEIKEKHESFRDDFEALAEEYRELEARYDQDVREAFERWHQEEFEIVAYDLYRATHNAEYELEEKMPDENQYEVPEPAVVPLDDDCLYDSTREYIPQLMIYKQFAGKFSHLVEEDEEEED